MPAQLDAATRSTKWTTLEQHARPSTSCPSNLAGSDSVAVSHNADPATAVQRLSERLAKRIGHRKYDMWFGRAQLQVQGNKVEVNTDTPFVAKWIDSHFTEALKSVVSETLGETAQVEVRVGLPGSHADSRSADQQGSRPSHDQVLHDRDDHRRSDPPGSGSHNGAGTHHRNGARHGGRAPAMRRLEDFVVGTSNALAHSAACRLAEDADIRGFSPLFIHGECGVGKTHLLQGICQRWIDLTGKSTGVRYVTAEDFTNEFITALRSDKLDAFRNRIRRLDLLAIDDVHFLSNKIRTQSEFLYTLDAIGLSGARIVMASDDHPRHIKKFNQALMSRCLSGMVVKIERPDREMRLELIKRLAAARGMVINPAAAESIASQCVGSVRELQGAVTKLAAFNQLMSNEHRASAHDRNGMAADTRDAAAAAPVEIGAVLASQLFNDQATMLGRHPGAPVRLATVIDTVCKRLNVTRIDLTGSGRHKRVVLARAMVAYLGREMTTHSFPEIAQALGRTFHSTIHTADQRLRKQLADNQTTDIAGTDQPLGLKELADQLKYEIGRATE